jgi:hypothetical protein
MTESTKQSIPGYEFGSQQSAKSPLSMEELRQLEQTLGWTGEDERLLRKHIEFFAPRPNPWWMPGAQSSGRRRTLHNGSWVPMAIRTMNTRRVREAVCPMGRRRGRPDA